MDGGRVVLLVVGVLLALVGLGTAAAGGGILWADGTQRGPDGYLTSPTFALSTDTAALVAEELLLDVHSAEDWVPWTDELALRLQVTSDVERPIFLGVGPAADVEAYLDGVARASVTRLGPGSDDVSLETSGGTGAAEPPGEQTFWVAQVQGTGSQRLAWDLASGEWSVVVMNADAAPGVAVAASAGALADFLRPVGAGLIGIGLLAAAVLIVVAAASPGRPRDGVPPARTAPQAQPGQPAAAPPSPAAAVPPHPVTIRGRLDEPLSRGLWLVKWVLVLPHLLVLAPLWAAFVIITLVAGVAILVTGRYPRGIFDFNVGVIRWSWRVAYYSYAALGTDAYPPFTLAETGHPATFEIAYPPALSRGLVLVKWLLALPHLVIASLLIGGGTTWTIGEQSWGDPAVGTGGGIIGVLVLVAGLVVLVRGRYPRGLFDLVMGLNRWVYRVLAYVALMTDVYPPFRLDEGGEEPQPAGPPPAPPAPQGRAADELIGTTR